LETRVGTFKYFDGIPTEETAAAIYNHLDYIRGVESFLNGMPAASLEAIRRGQASLGAKNCNQVLIFDQLMDSNPLFLTGNTDTVYVSVFLDLKKDGPTVIEIPPGTGPGTVNDAFFRFVTDTGPPGPDQGKGGKYLILPPDYVLLQGEVPDDYFKYAILGVEAPAWQGAKTQEYLDIPSFRNAARRDASASKMCSFF
jgi:hypothetical protein